MSPTTIVVIGGTSDARGICRQLEAAGLRYTLFVATAAGRELAADVGGEILCGRLDEAQMTDWLLRHRTRWVIDASHPYAEQVSRNIVAACRRLGVTLSRYQRPDLLAGFRHPLLIEAASLAAACTAAMPLGERILLTTGSKTLAQWRAGLPGKTLLARVLPTAEAVAQCAALGFGVTEIFALCGPFSAEFNAAFYRQCRAEAVIVKASGAEGGFAEKVAPCLQAGIPCVVLTRPPPAVTGDELLEDMAAFAQRLARWRADFTGGTG